MSRGRPFFPRFYQRAQGMIEGRIVLDLRAAHPELTGIGRYALNLCQSLEELSPRIDLHVLATTSSRSWLEESVRSRIHEAASSRDWDDLVLPGLLRELGAIIYHTPLFILPAVRSCAYLSTIHDVIPLARPDLTPAAFQRFFAAHVRQAVRRADHIVTVSSHSENDLGRFLGIERSRLRVIPETVSRRFSPVQGDALRTALAAFKLMPGFILSVGAFDLRKNLIVLLDAYLDVQRRKPGRPQPLVFVGSPSGDTFDLEKEIATRHLTHQARVLGRVPDEALPALYSGAGAFVFPSLYEGFGLPLLEAMACGAPVIASSTTSIPEVAGDAAILVDPHRPQELAKALIRIMDDPTLREDLQTKGFRRVRQFSLKAQGDRLLELYEAVLRKAA